MRARIAMVGFVALALAGFAGLPATAAATPTEASFPGGSLTGLAVDSTFTQGSFQNLSYSYERCGTQPAEETCTWGVRVTLYSDPARRCAPSTPESQLLYETGERSGNGSMALGPFGFGLEGCPGQILSGFYEERKTFDPEQQEGPWKVLVQGGSASLFAIGIGSESAAEAEQRIREASPPAHPALPVVPARMAIIADCRSLKIGTRRYAFVFRRMGCRKAADLATMAYQSSAAPSGYRCADKARGGMRCHRRGQPKKYVEWHIPVRAPIRR